MTALYLHEDVKELLAGKTLVVIGDSGRTSLLVTIYFVELGIVGRYFKF